jgi:hypothetical protein
MRPGRSDGAGGSSVFAALGGCYRACPSASGALGCIGRHLPSGPMTGNAFGSFQSAKMQISLIRVRLKGDV